jgi:hypothetical protein
MSPEPTPPNPSVRPPPRAQLLAFLVPAVLFVIGLVVLDRAVGAGLDALFARTRTGEVSGAVNATLDHRDADVLLFGSSRAKQHFDPSVIRERTGLDAYNAAANGQGLPYALGIQALLEARGGKNRCHVLHVDIVDLIGPKVSRAALLLPFSREVPEILAIQDSVDRWARLKSWSWLWRYNSVALSVLRNQFSREVVTTSDGFEPRKAIQAGFADPREFLGPPAADGRLVLDARTEPFLDEFVARSGAMGAGVMLVTSPLNRPGALVDGVLVDPVRVEARAWLEAWAAKNGVTYRSYDEERTPELRDPELFVDPAHMKAEGATILSARLADDLATGCRPPG